MVMRYFTLDVCIVHALRWGYSHLQDKLAPNILNYCIYGVSSLPAIQSSLDNTWNISHYVPLPMPGLPYLEEPVVY